jgi:hypothetical protein
MQWIIYIIAIVILYCLWQWKFPPRAVVEMAKGIVQEDPESLAAKANVPIEQYSLARVGQSEEGLSSDKAKIAVMWATLNHAQSTGQTITALVTKGNKSRSDYQEANGRYGRQGIHPYCTTIADPKPHTIELAGKVLSGEIEDPTYGAEFWDNPIAQRALHLANPWSERNPGGYRSPEEIAERRMSKGLALVNIPGVTTRFWVQN